MFGIFTEEKNAGTFPLYYYHIQRNKNYFEFFSFFHSGNRASGIERIPPLKRPALEEKKHEFEKTEQNPVFWVVENLSHLVLECHPP